MFSTATQQIHNNREILEKSQSDGSLLSPTSLSCVYKTRQHADYLKYSAEKKRKLIVMRFKRWEFTFLAIVDEMKLFLETSFIKKHVN